MLYRNDIIKGEMAAQGWTVDVLATELELSTNTISAARNGDDMRMKNLFKIVDRLKIPRSKLFEPKEAATPETVAAQ